METKDHPVDDLYGDLGQGLYDSALCHDEDSVDIYSGLEDSPWASRGTGKEGFSISPHRLKESMDLYEQLITEEQEEKESTYNELKSKFDAAQNQVQELFAKLEQVQKQNSSLYKENTLLKKNFSALIKTARMEIVRKDEEISQLNNRRSWGGCHQYRVEKSQVFARHSLNCNSGLIKESHDHKENRVLPEASQHKGESRLSGPPVYSGTSTNAAPTPFSVLPRCTRSDPDSSLHSQSKNSEGVDSLYLQHLQNHKHVQSDRTSVNKERESTYSEAAVLKSYNGITANQKVHEETSGRQLDGKVGGKQIELSQDLEGSSKEKDMSGKAQSKVDKNQLQKEQREPSKMNCVSSQGQRQQNEGPLVLRRSGRSKSPSSQPQPVSTPKVHSQTSRAPSRESMDAQAQGRNVGLPDNQRENRHSRDPEGSGDRRGARGSVSEISCGSKSGLFLDRNVEKRGTREHHRKEERRPEDVNSSERRRTRSDRSREHKKMRQSEGRNRQEGSSSRGDRRNTRSESSKEHEQRSTKGDVSGAVDKLGDKRDKDRRNRSHADVRESRRDAPIKYGVHCNDPTQRKKDHEQGIDKRKAYGRTEEQSARSIASRDHSRNGKSSLSLVSHASSCSSGAKEKCVAVSYDKDRMWTDKGKEITSLDTKSKGSFPPEENTRSASPEKCRIGEDGHTIESVQAECVATVQSPLTLNSSCDIPAMAEESSPKRKLTFMETLNLTLSPVKKQSQPALANEPFGPTPGDAPEGSSLEDNVSFALGEEFCVLDEIENSQLSVEAMDEAPATTLDVATPYAATQLATSTLDNQPMKSQDVTPSSTEPSPGLLIENKLDFTRRFNGDMNESLISPLKEIAVDSERQEQESITKADDSLEPATSISQNCAENPQCALNFIAAAEVHFSAEESEAVVAPSPPLPEATCKELESQTSTNMLEEDRSENSVEHSRVGIQPEPGVTLLKQSNKCQEEVSTSADTQAITKTCCDSDTSVSLEVVSSTVSVDIKPQNQDSCADSQTAISVMESTGNLEKPVTCPRSLEGPWAEVVSISSTSTEEVTRLEQTTSFEPDSTENEGQNSKLSSSTVVLHDEDSMMLVLSNIKVIPEAISPLTSPVRQTKKVQEQDLGKEQHVRSLSKDLSASAVVSEKDAWKMDMNKENKRPGSSATPNVPKDQQEPLSFTATEQELEEGEIVSDEDEEDALVIQSPQNEKTKWELRTHSSPRSPGLEKKTSQMRPTVTPKRHEEGSAPSSKDSPTFNKRRFKTVSAPSKANITTSIDFMNTLSFIRSELRRKYMKLHKNVTKTAFCCIIDMSLASFTEFVDGINFQRFCSQGNVIKPRLNKIITSVMSKVSSNGIVNRIFDQRADDLKQKLWNFVDGQFDFLFKELKAALKNVSDLSKNKPSENKHSNPRERENLNVDVHKTQTKDPLTVTQHKRMIKAKAEQVGADQQQKATNPPRSIPIRARGLGSSGKNIKATMEEVPQVPAEQTSEQLPAGSSSEKCLPESIPVPENMASTYARRLSHSGSMHDRSDFEILTEQQTSSLTFNLVTDSQMGDIFRCLLQGSDLLEAGVGDHQSWPLNTPKKEGSAGESLIGVVTPSKIISPSKLITWTSISPYKFTSPNSKIQLPLNPALLDENCLLEVPSNPLPNHPSPALTMGNSQQPFSILTEDLAVSLTIPSPLKSDGHLSFLHPACGQPLSVPSNVITAHYGEDALLDGEDATEQDIHLSLETDNSSCSSSTGETWDGTDPVAFQFKPNLPMQAEIMERSNDHFIVRIRHTSPGAHEEYAHVQKETPAAAQTALHEDACASVGKPSSLDVHPRLTSNERTEVQTSDKDAASSEESSPASLPKTTKNPAELKATDVASASCTSAVAEKGNGVSEAKTTYERTSRKRRKRYSGPKEKRLRREKSQDGRQKQKLKKRSKSPKHRGERTPSKKAEKTGSPQLSPSSLSAKNVVRKKGEVVVTWT
ncbi:hypothetical protein P4O66_019841, partial [Electrophorus voltai]